MLKEQRNTKWQAWKDSNPQPPHLECGALTSSSYRPACGGYFTLLALLMQGMFVTELAIFLFFKFFGSLFLVDKRHIVAALACCALKTDDIRHYSFTPYKKFLIGG